MKKNLTLFFLTFIIMSMIPPVDFLTQQLKFPRVQAANREKRKIVEEILLAQGINSTDFELFLRGFKKEQKLEVWAKNKGNGSYALLKTYDFCANTGVLGPKRRSGDRQIPEGFYIIDSFNPQSQYHLSFRVNYPNKSDLVFADKLNPGDNIFIHGDCVTIGCIPIGNENIKELYLLAAKAKNAGGTINVHIFPSKLDDIAYNSLKQEYASNQSLLQFWSWLKPAYDAFENNRILPNIVIDEAGKYLVN
ncbi:L,D-transpeptidase family protein [Emticicia sp. SJ17W-69]|uniref:L,D-transpeptidase family protein n=1 Tax=Emticicia sp. SJ17W-69 TaxID=3421657 RepID=UPI003EBD13BF